MNPAQARSIIRHARSCSIATGIAWTIAGAIPALAHDGEVHAPKVEPVRSDFIEKQHEPDGFDLKLDIDRFRLAADTPVIGEGEWKLLLIMEVSVDQR